MKVRMPVLFIILLGGVLLAWLFGSTRRRDAEVQKKPYWAAQIDELSELGRYKHVAAVQYDDYAETAEAGRQAAAARLFHALSHSEHVHEMNCADVVRRLGGHYTPPGKVIILRGTTPGNLDRALGNEIRNYDLHYRTGAIERALNAGNRYAARAMIRIAGGDMRHIELLERFTERPDSSGYAVCPNCGNLFCTACCDCYCPFCETAGTEFVLFE